MSMIPIGIVHRVARMTLNISRGRAVDGVRSFLYEEPEKKEGVRPRPLSPYRHRNVTEKMTRLR